MNMNISSISLDDERFCALRLASLGGFEVDGHYWPTPEHYLIAARFTEPDARERLRKEWDVDKMRALAASLDSRALGAPDWAAQEQGVLRRAVQLSIESNLGTRALLLATGGAAIVGGGDSRVGPVLEAVREIVALRAGDPDALQCVHQGATEAGHFCVHVLDAPYRTSAHRWFRGIGATYVVVCAGCAEALPKEPPLRRVCARCFRIPGVRTWLGNLGWPAHATRASDLELSTETIAIVGLPSALAAITPMHTQGRWLALTRDGVLLMIDARDRYATPFAKIEEGTINLASTLDLHVAPSDTHVAIVEAYGLRGAVVDLTKGRTTMALAREEYHPEVCRFPAAFIERGGRSLLVHAVAWNRLEISDPRSGALLTPRDPLIYPRGGPCPPHYLDYFHGALLVSPDGRTVLDDGWMWHPVGVLRAFDVVQWLEENPYESEDGASVRDVAVRDTWDRPACWIDERTVAVWGYGLGDDPLEDEFVPGVSIFDVTTGTPVRRFLGPPGALAFDEHLFAFDREHGLTAWDVVTGERLLHAPEFRPTGYHRSGRCFFAVGEGMLTLGRVIRDGKW